jgi:hypothetical protein
MNKTGWCFAGLILLAGLAEARPVFRAYASGDAYYCGAGAARLTINYDGEVIAYAASDAGRIYDLIGTYRKCACFLFCGETPGCRDASLIGGSRPGVNCAWVGTYQCARGTPEFEGVAEVGLIEGPVARDVSNCVSFTCTDPVY